MAAGPSFAPRVVAEHAGGGVVGGGRASGGRVPGILAFLALLAVAACGSPAEPPDPSGEVSIVLDGALPDDAAAILSVTSGATGLAAPGPAVEVFSRRSGGGHTIAVFGPLATGPIVTMTVADTAVVPDVTVHEVAASDGSLRASVAGYTARTVRR